MPTKKSRRIRVQTLEPRHHRIMEVLSSTPLLTLTELASILDKQPESVMSDLSQMRGKGVPIETLFQYGATRYRIVGDEPFTPAQMLALQLTMQLDQLSTEELHALIDACQKTIETRQAEEN